MIFGLAACGKSSKGEDTIKIGWIAPLSGSGAATGDFVVNGLEIWKQDYGTINGKPVEIIIEDTQSSDQGAANAYLKLCSRGDLAAIGGCQYSSQGLACLDYTAQYKIPTIHHGSSVRFAQAVEEGNVYTWQNRINDTGTGASLADAAVKVLGMKSICILNDTDSFGNGLGTAVENRLAELGVTPTLRLEFVTGEANFDGYVAQMKDKGCDGVIICAHPNEAALIQVACDSWTDLIKLGSPDAGSSTTLKLSADKAIGWYSISDFVPTIDTELGSKFVKEYVEKFGINPDMNSSSAYDILTMFKLAIEAANSTDPAKVNDALMNVEFDGVAAHYKFNEKHLGATSQFLCINEKLEDGSIAPVIMDKITRADML